MVSFVRRASLVYLLTFLSGANALGVADALELTRYPSIWRVTATTVTIAWQTDRAAEGTVLYGTTPALGSVMEAPDARTDPVVTLAGLAPGTRYYYRVASGAEALGERNGSFETAPATNEAFRFLAFGDVGRATSAQKQLANRIEDLDADLAILTGDIVYESGEAANFTPQYFAIYRSSIERIPFYPVLGNHDVLTRGGQPFLDAFHLPAGSGTERYYSFDYSNAHFVALEVVDEGKAPNAEMLSWLDRDLAISNKQWTFVYFHVPMYSDRGGHGGDSEVAAALEPILNAHGVDLVIQGHNHFYSRTYPIRSGQVLEAQQDPAYSDPEGTVYVVTGGGGHDLDPVLGSDAQVALSKSRHHVTQIDVNGSRLSLRAIDRNGDVFDTMTLTKRTTEPVDSGTAPALTVSAPWPNPSRGDTFLRFSQRSAGSVRVALYDALGRRVREIRSPGSLPSGTNEIAWDGRDGHGRPAPAGIYFARIEAAGAVATAKVVRIP